MSLSPQTMAECDCPRPSDCRRANTCLAAAASPRVLTVDETVALARIKAGTHVLVPRKATADMVQAGRNALTGWVAPVMHAEDARNNMIATYLASKLNQKEDR